MCKLVTGFITKKVSTFFRTSHLHYYHKGSVIQFITIDDIKECLSKSLLKSNQNKADFQAAIQQAKKFEELENLYENNLQLIRQARRAIFYKRSFL